MYRGVSMIEGWPEKIQAAQSNLDLRNKRNGGA